ILVLVEQMLIERAVARRHARLERLLAAGEPGIEIVVLPQEARHRIIRLASETRAEFRRILRLDARRRLRIARAIARRLRIETHAAGGRGFLRIEGKHRLGAEIVILPSRATAEARIRR